MIDNRMVKDIPLWNYNECFFNIFRNYCGKRVGCGSLQYNKMNHNKLMEELYPIWTKYILSNYDKGIKYRDCYKMGSGRMEAYMDLYLDTKERKWKIIKLKEKLDKLKEKERG